MYPHLHNLENLRIIVIFAFPKMKYHHTRVGNDAFEDPFKLNRILAIYDDCLRKGLAEICKD
jgi:hypothetical protein